MSNKNFDNTNLIGCTIKAARKAQGFTLKQLGAASGTSAGHLSDIENGKVVPGGELLISIQRTLEIDLFPSHPHGTEKHKQFSAAILADPAGAPYGVQDHTWQLSAVPSQENIKPEEARLLEILKEAPEIYETIKVMISLPERKRKIFLGKLLEEQEQLEQMNKGALKRP